MAKSLAPSSTFRSQRGLAAASFPSRVWPSFELDDALWAGLQGITLANMEDGQSWQVPELCLAKDGRLSIYFAPLQAVNAQARIVLLGLTPGLQQMAIACAVARDTVLAGGSRDEASRLAKARASFAGPMRKNLVAMLDEVGVAHHLGVSSCEELFGTANALVHTTSALRYPVFRDGKNYSGTGPAPTRSPLLMGLARSVLVPELAQVPNALILPLGKAVVEILTALQEDGFLLGRTWVSGFPHPSGGNGHRVRLFRENFGSIRGQIGRFFGQSDRT